MSQFRPGQKESIFAQAVARGMVDARDLLPKPQQPATVPLAPNPGQDSGATLPSPAAVKFTIPGAPMGKPRMTQRDKWKKRPSVVRYRAWADSARAAAPSDMPKDALLVSWTAFFPLPSSWSAKKKAAHMGTLHRAKPDRDNIDKALLDSLFKDDSGIAAGTLVKRWDDGGGPRLVVLVEGV